MQTHEELDKMHACIIAEANRTPRTLNRKVRMLVDRLFAVCCVLLPDFLGDQAERGGSGDEIEGPHAEDSGGTLDRRTPGPSELLRTYVQKKWYKK